MADDEPYDHERSRSIFSALWFRVLIVVLVLGVAAVLAVPYVLDLVSLPSTKTTAVRPPMPPPAPPPVASKPPGAPPTATMPGQPAPAQPMPSQPTPSQLTPPIETAKPEPAPPPAEAEKAAPTVEEPKPVAKAVESTKPRMEARAKPAVTRAGRGPYWVQVGAFKEADAAKRLVERLRADNYTVQESVKPDSGAASAPAPAPAAPPADRYNVFISGTGPAEVDSKLSAKGLTAESVAGGTVVKPSLPLRDAVTLSRELAGEGLRVQVRRAVSDASPSAAPAAAMSNDGLHRVRVGSFPDRASAMGVLKELEAKGYKPFLARGTQ